MSTRGGLHALVLLACLVAVAPGVSRASVEDCSAVVRVAEDGRLTSMLCVEQARALGFTLVDLSDAWAPRVLAGSTADETSYRPSYVALADERLGGGDTRERYLELFGVFPTLRVLRERVLDAPRHACHAAVGTSALASLSGTLSPYATDLKAQQERVERLKKTRAALRGALRRLGLERIEELEQYPEYRFTLRRFARDDRVVRAIEDAQAHLRCEGLLRGRVRSGVLDTSTVDALRVYQREHVVIATGALDALSKQTLVTDSRELVFRAALRVLRERVVAALGLIEDGSAGGAYGQVLGRDLDPPQMRLAAPDAPTAPRAAPDLISPATEAAARALGWLDAASLTTSLAALYEVPEGLSLIAIRLPAVPAYHAPHMELRAEIDRGDVVYEPPYRLDGTRRMRPIEHRPTLTLLVKDGDGDAWTALVRFPTTIGGWQRERTPQGRVGLRYKESPVGPRLWRDLVAAPAWLPPATTPDSELVEYDWRTKEHALKRTLFGPGYRSAYGLAMLVHLKEVHGARERTEASAAQLDLDADEARFGSASLFDQGARTHGTAFYESILQAHSHGCHRLFNHLILRLTGFLLAHRAHVAHGPMRTLYARKLSHSGKAFVLRLRTRGERYELTPPVPITVLEGRVVGPVRKPLRGLWPLPERAVQR